MSGTVLLGRYGEALAAEYLRKKGCRILAMNYRTRLGELDVIAADRRYVIFAEVKLRKNAAFAEAREFVTFAKRQKLAAAAEEWLQKNPQKLQPRFDVIEIYAPDGVDTIKPDIRHWENAFTLDQSMYGAKPRPVSNCSGSQTWRRTSLPCAGRPRWKR